MAERQVDINSSAKIAIRSGSGGGTGMIMWDCTHVAVAFLNKLDRSQSQSESFWKGKKVLELGSGTGLLGIVAASLGASCASDKFALTLY